MTGPVKFALNYSPQAATLLSDGHIAIDVFKCPDWPDLLEAASTLRPVYIHFPLLGSQGPLPDDRLRNLSEWQQRTRTPYINTHLGLKNDTMDDPQSRQETMQRLTAHVQSLVDHFGAEAVMAENVPYPDIFRDKNAMGSEADVIREVIETTGCGLLLDLAHARLTAEHHGWDVYAYIEALPVHRLRELHVTGVGANQEGRPEDHLPMTDADWALFEWAITQIASGQWARPWGIACEYGGIGPLFEWRSEADVIAQDVPRMVALVQTLNA